MADRPTDPLPPDRPLDNEPTPLLTYGGASGDKKDPVAAARGSRRIWGSTLLLLLLGAGGYAMYVLTRTPASDASLEVAPLPPTGPMATSGPTITPLTATDTTVTPGSEVLVAIRANEGGDRPASDVLVRFEIVIGAGTREVEAFTNPSGVAAATVTLPARPSRAVVRVSSPSIDAPGPTFRISALTGPPASLDPTAGEGQEADAGELLGERLEVEVLDADGIPVPGVELFFEVATGGGLAAPSRARTDSLGLASAIWRLGSAAGPQTLVVSSDELTESVTFTATARPTEQAAAATPDPAPAEPTPPSNAPVTVLTRNRAIGGANVCEIQGGRVTCRGANDRGQGIDDALPGSRAVTAGLFHACALDGAGVASCWGANDAGQLGDGSLVDRAAPVAVATDRRFSDLAAGVSHTCGLSSGGQAMCWGANLGGQLGDGSRNDRTVPTEVSSSTAFRTIVAGWNHTCAVTAAGAAFCWGLNRDGAVGDGSRLDRLTPVRVLDGVDDLTAGSGHTCALRDGRVLCWGGNASGQLGDGSLQPRLVPTAVVDLPGTVTSVAAGAAHTCALLSDGSAHCWGQNLHGQLGNGSNAASATPSAVEGGLTFTSIHAGGGVTCGLTGDGAEYCWGLNQNGELGDGTRANRSRPTRVTGG